MKQEQKKRIKAALIILVIFFLVSFFFSSIFSLFISKEPIGNVALIPIKGIIYVDGVNSFGEITTSSTDFIEQLEKADKNPSIKAIVLDINSPGGSAVASKEIADKIKQTNKTTVAVIREVGASGGYWAASAADHIISNEMS
ncbi:hypothetical protein GF361_05400, partial [Candidatus Woesearchaeota archaeon]|nr:hypothetical protein [Candidatus Woesearchaeota archaeon]